MLLKAVVGVISAAFISVGYVNNVFDNRDVAVKSTASAQHLTEEDEELDQLDHDSNFNDVLDKYKNYCLNGQNSKDLSTKQRLDAFNAGPCAPLVMVPGILGTALQVMIDCEKLRDNFPTIFEGCGWSTCSSLNIFRTRPSSEYRLWIGDLFSKSNFIQTSKKTTCFGDMFSLLYNSTTSKLEDKPGLKVTWVGNTPETMEDSKCGADAIQNLSDDIIIKKVSCSVGGYRNLIKLLDKMGYQSGITYQAIPYDFRQDAHQSDTNIVIPQAINHLFSLTAKKVVVLGHSLGNIQILNVLTKMTQTDKDLKVFEFIAAGPPFLGAPKVLINMLGGDPDYLKKILGKQIGMNFYSQYKLITSCSSSFDLLPRDIFSDFKEKEWTAEILKRIEYEDSLTPVKRAKVIVDPAVDIDEYDPGQEKQAESQGDQESKSAIETLPPRDKDAPFNFMPSPREQCLEKDVFVQRKSGKCDSSLDELLNPFVVKIVDKEFKATQKELNEIIKDHSLLVVEEAMSLKAQSDNAKGLRNLDNPQVPITVIYGNHQPTLTSLEYNSSTREHYEKTKDFLFPDKRGVGLGDGTVPTYSALVPALKWAYEQLHGVEGAKKVRIVELCSHFQGYSEEQDENKKDDSTYKGIDCECQHGKNQSTCQHSCFINDAFFLDLIASTLVKSSQSLEQKPTNILTNEQLNNLTKECPSLKVKAAQ